MARTEEDDLLRIPQRHLSEVEVQYINLSIERARLKREQSQNILNKGIMLFFAFMLVAVILSLNGMIEKAMANILIIAGLVVLAISVIPYMTAVKDEEKKLSRLMEKLLGEKPKD
jgi:uncharacterized membrane protein